MGRLSYVVCCFSMLFVGIASPALAQVDVPEPATMTLLGLAGVGALGLRAVRSRRK
jgi:xanthosine utilization system XapX-like protein